LKVKKWTLLLRLQHRSTRSQKNLLYFEAKGAYRATWRCKKKNRSGGGSAPEVGGGVKFLGCGSDSVAE